MWAGYQDSVQAGGVEAELAALHREALTRVAEPARLDELCNRTRALVAKAAATRSRQRHRPAHPGTAFRRRGDGALASDL
jgi:hypothetical protein